MGYLPIDIDTAAMSSDGQTLSGAGGDYADVESAVGRLPADCLGGVARSAFETYQHELWEYRENGVRDAFDVIGGGAISTAATVVEADLPIVRDTAGDGLIFAYPRG